jgi:protein-tyrosine-phosphatase
VEAARALGVDLAPHRSRLTDDLVTGRVLVLAMEPWQQRQAVELLGCAPENVLLLGDFDPDPSADSAIPDPLGGPASAHAACFERIERCVRSLIAALGWTEGGNRPAAGQAAAPAAGSLGR